MTLLILAFSRERNIIARRAGKLCPYYFHRGHADVARGHAVFSERTPARVEEISRACVWADVILGNGRAKPRGYRRAHPRRDNVYASFAACSKRLQHGDHGDVFSAIASLHVAVETRFPRDAIFRTDQLCQIENSRYFRGGNPL